MTLNPHSTESLVRHIIAKLRQGVPCAEILKWLEEERGFDEQDARRLLGVARKVETRLMRIQALWLFLASLLSVGIFGCLFLFRPGASQVGYGWLLGISTAILFTSVCVFGLAQLKSWRRKS